MVIVGRVGTVVHILLELTALACRTAPPTHQADRVHLQENGDSAPAGISFGIKDVCLSEGKLLGLHSRRILVQQKPEIRRGLMSSCN